MASAAFEGLRVLDLSDRLSGAFAARLFGDFGADVLLAEPPQGHPLRREPPFLDDQPTSEGSVVHAYVNWNKRSRVIAGADELAGCVAEADVVVTTADPIEGSAIGAALKHLRADAVHLSITPHGAQGPLAGRRGNNLTASARTGWSYINACKDEPPLQMPRDQAGFVGGVAGFVAAAAALRRRGCGEAAERVDVSELEAFALTAHPWAVAAIYDGAGATRGPSGGRTRGAPGPLYQCADGRMTLAVAAFNNWTAAMDVLGLPELGRRAELIPEPGRNAKDLSDVMKGLARTLPTLQRWPTFEALGALRCGVGVLETVDDILHDKQLAARGFLVETWIEDRKVHAAGAPARLSPEPWRLRRPAPRLGDDDVPDDSAPTARTRPAKPPRSARVLAEGPLSGVRVLSFTQAWSGAFGAELLGLLGADVVQVSAPGRPDVWRRTRYQVPKAVADPGRTQHPLNTQGLYNSVNLNKREIALDLNQAKGREILWRLFGQFDVIVDNFRGGVMSSWGVTLEKLQALRPGVIWGSLSGYGDDGPYTDFPANGSTIEPMSGLSSLHGYEGDPGMNTGGLYPDPVSGYFFAATIIAALHRRDRVPGEAQRIDVSMMEAVNVVCGDAVIEREATGRLPGPRGNHHPRIAPHNNYAALGGEWLALAAETEDAWAALAACIGDARLAQPRFASMADRKANEAELDAIVAEWCVTQDAAEAEDRLGRLGVTAARVAPLYELYSKPDAGFLASGFVTLVDHPEAGGTWLPGRPWRFSASPASPVQPAPCVGQHSREVLTEALGLGEHEYEALVAAGVTGSLEELATRAEAVN